ncbi:MAG: signal peptidase II [Candidatus Kapabacteria bacterium]|nr:signal peptidase II [Candidatus Kapabacteria bacterium]
MHTGIRPFLVAGVLVVVDQITKALVKGFDVMGFHHQGMVLGESRPLIGETLRLTFVENPGMAFGVSWGDAKIILTLLTIGIVVLIVRMILTTPPGSRIVRNALVLVLAGAVGNLIDRMFYGVLYGTDPLFYGKVVDFLQVDIPDVTMFGELYTHWPVFNVADSCVSVGVVVLLLASLFGNADLTLFRVQDERAE